MFAKPTSRVARSDALDYDGSNPQRCAGNTDPVEFIGSRSRFMVYSIFPD